MNLTNHEIRRVPNPVSLTSYQPKRLPPMFKFYAFASVMLFWVTLSASLFRVHVVSSPVYKMRVPAYRSLPVRSVAMAQIAQIISTNN